LEVLHVVLEQIDLDLKLKKTDYRRIAPELQARLFDRSQDVIETGTPVIIIFEGWAGTAKAQMIRMLSGPLDPRGLRVHAITPPRTYETHYPWMQRFWLRLPSHGQMAIFDRSWYRQLLNERTRGDGDQSHWRNRCADLAAFERMLSDAGTILIKFWLHISRKEQRRRFKQLEADRFSAWRVNADDRWQQRHYPRVARAVEDMIARTDTADAPWRIIPATNTRYARVAVLQTILERLEEHMDRSPANDTLHTAADHPNGAALRPQVNGQGRVAAASATSYPVSLPARSILQRVDLSKSIDPQDYSAQLKQLQAKLHLLGFAAYQQQRPVVIVFEGWDAAGKGGAIQRLTSEIDPRSYTVHAIAAPAGDDKVRHYLYRFWRRLPPQGQIAIFDRSWYGRVLVERVEGFARADEWQRAYAEINEFERQLVDFGTIVCKFWMHLSPEEQMRRFEERRVTPHKSWKLTDEDWRNREKWHDYEQAADEMLLRTSTPAAPWTIVEAEDKRFGRVKVLRTVVQRLESELGKIKL
jgi:polyphosphate:AMP phosphotransferase